jgi:hypothetical protein
MNPNSAYSLVTIIVGTDYTPSAQTITHKDGNTGAPTTVTVNNGLNSPVYAMFCTVTNTGNTQVQLLGDAAPTTFPAGSFKQGVIYYMYLKKLVADGGGSFVGFQYNAYPLAL